MAWLQLRQASTQFLVWSLFWQKQWKLPAFLRYLHAKISPQVGFVSTSHWYTHEMLKVRSSKLKAQSIFV